MLGMFGAEKITPDHMTSGLLTPKREAEKGPWSLWGAIQRITVCNQRPREGARGLHLAREHYLPTYLFHLDTKHLEGASQHLPEAVLSGWGGKRGHEKGNTLDIREESGG